MTTPHRCPVCNGSGLVYGTLYHGPVEQVPCRSCNGTGVVWSPHTSTAEAERIELRPIPGVIPGTAAGRSET